MHIHAVPEAAVKLQFLYHFISLFSHFTFSSQLSLELMMTVT